MGKQKPTAKQVMYAFVTYVQKSGALPIQRSKAKRIVEYILSRTPRR